MSDPTPHGTAGPSGPAVSRETSGSAHDAAGTGEGAVSRETTFAPDEVEVPPPGAVEAVFGARAALARRFAQHLVTSGVERGLIGPRETGRIWTRHVLNCAVLSELVPQDATLIDVGSGAGLPGLAVAISRPDVHVTLVEPLERRTRWLEEVVSDLGLSTRVVRARAEEVAGTERAQVVTARAVAALDKLARWCLPLVAPGGQLLAVKGRTAQAEVAATAPALARAGAVTIEVLTCGAASLVEPTTVVRVALGPEGYRAVRSRSGRRR